MGFGPWEVLFVVILALIFIGPTRLPVLGKSVFGALRGSKKEASASNDEK